MARPFTPSASDPNSVRLVQDSSSIALKTHPLGPKLLSHTTHPAAIEMDGPALRKSITLTRSVDVESTSSAGNRSPPGPTVCGGVAADAPNVPTMRTSKSAGALQKPLPSAPPRRSAEGARVVTASGHKSLPAPTAVSLTKDNQKSSNLPPFRQSRRWDQFYHTRPTGCLPKESPGDTPKTARERSMEEQRAELKPRVQAEKHEYPSLASKPILTSIKDDQSADFAGGFCRPLSMPTWHTIKVIPNPRPASVPSRLATRMASLRQKSAGAHKKAESVRSAIRPPSVRKLQLRRRLRLQPAFGDLRRRANASSKTIASEEKKEVVSSDVVDYNLVREKRSPSLVAILRNPNKFSEDWEASFSNPEFDKDWLTLAGQPMLSLNDNKKSIDSVRKPQQCQHAVSERLEVPVNKSGVAHVTIEPFVILSGEKASQGRMGEKARSAPDPPERTSSRGGAGLAQVAHFQKPKCMSIHQGPWSPALISPDSAVQATDPADGDVGPKQVNSRQQMASISSNQSTKGPKHAASTDSLAKIEDSLKSPRLPFMEKLKQNTAFIVVQQKRKRSNPSGLPPKGPLPHLPGSSSKVTANDLPQVVMKAPEKGSSISSAPSPEALPESHQDARLEGRRSSKKTSRRSRMIAGSEGLAIQYAERDNVSIGGAIPTPSSIHGQVSLDSQRSALLEQPFSRHDISNMRPDRAKDVRKRYLGHITREQRISEEDELKIGQEQPVDPIPLLTTTSLHAQPSVDDLEKFPAVPTSRPQSCASTRRPQSRSKVHARQSSRTSSTQRAPITLGRRQTLGRSDIKILVNADLSTGWFRAGAMSPEPSLTGSREGSPMRLPRTGRRGSVQDIINTTKLAGKKNSMRSLKSHGSARKTKIANTTFRRGSGDGELDSEEDLTPLLTHSNGNISSTVSRGQDPGDVQAITCKVESLEDAVLRIERTLRKQQEVFQMIALTQARRVGVGAGVDDDHHLVRQHDARFHGATKSSKDGARPISDVSATSATTTATFGSHTQSSTGSGDASLTDPFEYDDIPLRRPETAKTNKSGATALHQPPPVAQVIPRGKLPEETSLLSRDDECEFDEDGNRRLSVNHPLTCTMNMDRSLETLRALG